MKTYDEFYRWVLSVCPSAIMSQDDDGQLIVHTGFCVDKDDLVYHVADWWMEEDDDA
jgi:hypothetical protein